MKRDIFRCRDRWDRDIVLTEDCWRLHILVRHPEFAGNEGCLQATLVAPVVVNQDAVRPNREAFYARSPLPRPFSRVYVKVVVEFHHVGPGLPPQGEVITSHFVDQPNPKEQRLWP